MAPRRFRRAPRRGAATVRGWPGIVAVLCLVAACQRGAAGTPDGDSARARAAKPDSATSMTVLLRRFQAAAPGRPEELTHAASSRDSLVARFMTALHARDAGGLERLRVSRAEFGHLFFPESIFMRPPYDLDPAIVWLQIDAASGVGARRALERQGGRQLAYHGLACQPPQRHGEVQLHGCDVLVRDETGGIGRLRMFGAILERRGAFKFLSLENRL